MYDTLLQPRISVVPVQDFREKIARKKTMKNLASKSPFYIFHNLTSSTEEEGEGQLFFPNTRQGEQIIEAVSTHFNALLSHALFERKKKLCIPCKASTLVNLICLTPFLTMSSSIQHSCSYCIRIEQ